MIGNGVGRERCHVRHRQRGFHEGDGAGQCRIDGLLQIALAGQRAEWIAAVGPLALHVVDAAFGPQRVERSGRIERSLTRPENDGTNVQQDAVERFVQGLFGGRQTGSAHVQRDGVHAACQIFQDRRVGHSRILLDMDRADIPAEPEPYRHRAPGIGR